MGSEDFDQVIAQYRAALDTIRERKHRGVQGAVLTTGGDHLGNPLGGFGRGWEQVVAMMERAASHYR